MITVIVSLLDWSGRKGEGFLSWNSEAITWEDSCSVQFGRPRGKRNGDDKSGQMPSIFPKGRGVKRGFEDSSKQVEEHWCCANKQVFIVAIGD